VEQISTYQELNHKLEITVNSITSALIAQNSGADRIELCDNFAEGGTTPSAGAIQLARKHLTIELFVIIRPRGGDFLYNDIEFEIMKQDIIFAKEAGIDGVVFGILKEDGTVDHDRNLELVQLAGPMQTTFHRAFDMTVDPFKAIEDIISLGFNRILSSGQKPTAIGGAGLLAELVKMTEERIILMPGSGIDEDNISYLASRTKAREFHGSFRKTIQSEMKFKNEQAFMGKANSSEYESDITDSDRIQKAVHILKTI